MIETIISTTAIGIAFIFLCVSLFATIECLAGTPEPRKRTRLPVPRPRLAILVAAHNEEDQISDAVSSIRAQMTTTDRLLVVADNCDDNTAAKAVEAGARVVERIDHDRRGKGYAIDAGLKFLAADPPEVLVVIDADCWLEPGTLDELAGACWSSQRPVQSRYLMLAPGTDNIKLAVSQFAFLVKNRVRALGLFRLGLPVQLNGSGMAFPWSVISKADLATGDLVEDLRLGLELAQAGHAPTFCDKAVVKSYFPSSQKGQESQATRWASGRFAMTSSLFSALIRPATYVNGRFLVLVLDALVPPLSLLIALLVFGLAATGALAVTGITTLPFVLCAAGSVAFATSLSIAWWVHGRDILPFSKLIGIPGFIVHKLSNYPRQMLAAHRLTWVRTDRKRPSGV